MEILKLKKHRTHKVKIFLNLQPKVSPFIDFKQLLRETNTGSTIMRLVEKLFIVTHNVEKCSTTQKSK